MARAAFNDSPADFFVSRGSSELGGGSPGVVPLRAEAGQRAPGVGHELVDHEQAVPAQLHQPLAALQLLRRHHLAALIQDGLPRRPAGWHRGRRESDRQKPRLLTLFIIGGRRRLFICEPFCTIEQRKIDWTVCAFLLDFEGTAMLSKGLLGAVKLLVV